MRREQILKICLNHILTADIEYRPKDDKTWLFTAPDFSEGEINHCQFCLRFKTPEVAQSFKKAVDDALQGSSDDGKFKWAIYLSCFAFTLTAIVVYTKRGSSK